MIITRKGEITGCFKKKTPPRAPPMRGERGGGRGGREKQKQRVKKAFFFR
jgi:hypothetical protein